MKYWQISLAKELQAESYSCCWSGVCLQQAWIAAIPLHLLPDLKTLDGAGEALPAWKSDPLQEGFDHSTFHTKQIHN